MVMLSSFSTMLNQASRWAFWKAPPHDEMVSVFLSCAAACGSSEQQRRAYE